jgi:hypothetical protein
MSDHAVRRAGALAKLPTVHALALRLRDEGEPPEHIAMLLGIEQEALGPLLEVAAAKLEEILTDRLR